MFGLHLDDLAQPIGQPANPRNVERHERVQPGLHPLPHDHRPRIGIGKGRAVAEELRHDMKRLGKRRDLRRRTRRLEREIGKEFRHGFAGGLCAVARLRCGRMQLHELRNRGPGARLPTLIEPHPRDHRREIRPPDAGHEGRLTRRSHRARRGTEHIAQTVRRIARPALRRHGADPAGMGVDQPGRDRRSGRQAHLRGGCLGQPCPERRARIDNARADPLEAVLRQIAKADRVEIVRIPAALMRKIGPFAGDRAGGALQRATRLPCQEIGKVEELHGLRVDLGALLAQPHQFRRLHLRRDPAAHIAQHVMIARIDPRRLIAGAVIHPDDDIALGRIRIAHGQPALRAHHGERTGRVEPDPRDIARVGPRRGEGPFHRIADGLPYLGARLLDMAMIVLPHLQRVLADAEKRALPIENPGARRTGSDIDTDE